MHVKWVRLKFVAVAISFGQDRIELRIVVGQIASVQYPASIESLETVRIEPELRSFRPILLHRRGGVFLKPQIVSQGICVGCRDPFIKAPICTLDREQHIVGKFVDEDRLPPIPAYRQAQDVLFGPDHAFAPDPAGPFVPIFPVGLRADPFVVMLQFASGQARVVTGRLGPVRIFRQIKQRFVAGNERDAIIVGNEPCREIGPVSEHAADHVACREKCRVRDTGGGEDRYARRVHVLAVERIRRKPRGRRTCDRCAGRQQRRRNDSGENPHCHA